MILSISGTPLQLVDECYNCGKQQTINVTDLKLGQVMQKETHCDPAVVALPACSCGTQTVFYRTFEITHPVFRKESWYLHRQAVNALAKYLKDGGHVDPLIANEAATEPRVLVDITDIPMTMPLSLLAKDYSVRDRADEHGNMVHAPRFPSGVFTYEQPPR